MATKDPVSRKELLKPDEFQTTFGSLLAWAQGHQRTVFVGVVGVLVAIVLAFGLAAYAGHRRAAAFESYGKLQGAITKAVTDPSEANVKAVEDLAAQGLPSGEAGALAAYRLGAFHADRGDAAAAARYLHEAVDAGGPNLAAARYRLAGVL
ncbi:MAG: hypothetical protein KC466_06640 [Myxococcales bacterium]|nr:hypothetical protein [Myxococcales bacterium]